ncbi:RNA-binding protein [Paenibacillus larvae subsp. pulvifaciens]|uniref:RNA-binding protein n=1 Tax=Paenibacillus larvae subsp. pulvifaciens TaxID=1477 RepID=A0A1V0UQ23_9BACL|nr:S1-like domain-containing RNA-binding protein [Paenibacillus larvae]ARF67274.1 RNA-binding protein [Paenibacillus larvae subsp. pulvifaciens]
MNLHAGMIISLEIAREVSPYGYFLTNGNQDVLLHYSEITGEIKVGDQVEVFLYHDTENRLSATMKRPDILLGEVGLLEVVDRHPRFGAFLEMGLGRNLLLPVREMPDAPELRPHVGDKVFVKMDLDKQGRLIAKAATEKDLAPLCFRAPASWKNTRVQARVYKPLKMGTFAVCDGGVVGFGVIGFLPSQERIHQLRMGEEVELRVTFVREEDGRVNLSMREPKEKGRETDAEILLSYLKERPNGAMPYSDQTPADIISSRFQMSKSAFKRALGKLMREGHVYQKENWTYLKGSPDEK